MEQSSINLDTIATEAKEMGITIKEIEQHSQEILTSADTLSALSETLNQLVSRFKIYGVCYYFNNKLKKPNFVAIID